MSSPLRYKYDQSEFVLIGTFLETHLISIFNLTWFIKFFVFFFVVAVDIPSNVFLEPDDTINCVLEI